MPFALITMFLVSIVIQARKNKVLTGATGMIGEIGVARTALAPEGQVLVRGEYWDCGGRCQHYRSGTRVRVKAVEASETARRAGLNRSSLRE